MTGTLYYKVRGENIFILLLFVYGKGGLREQGGGLGRDISQDLPFHNYGKTFPQLWEGLSTTVGRPFDYCRKANRSKGKGKDGEDYRLNQ
jgi:hypothetical protein